MRLRERRDPDDVPAAAPGAPAERGTLLAAAERMLAAGDDAIERALSGDSEAFLAANRQEGGE